MYTFCASIQKGFSTIDFFAFLIILKSSQGNWRRKEMKNMFLSEQINKAIIISELINQKKGYIVFNSYSSSNDSFSIFPLPNVKNITNNDFWKSLDCDYIQVVIIDALTNTVVYSRTASCYNP